MFASQKGHTAVAQTLLEHNAQINLQNEVISQIHRFLLLDSIIFACILNLE